VVRYIRETRGVPGLTALLAAYGDGLGCSAGVERALGISLTTLEDRWRRDVLLTGPVGAPPPAADLAGWAALAAVVLGTPVLFFLIISLAPSARRPASS